MYHTFMISLFGFIPTEKWKKEFLVPVISYLWGGRCVALVYWITRCSPQQIGLSVPQDHLNQKIIEGL